jgi:hypothetical protein
MFVAYLPSKIITALQVTGSVTMNGWNPGELYAFHPTVCFATFGDGSVRPLKATMSLANLQRRAARRTDLRPRLIRHRFASSLFFTAQVGVALLRELSAPADCSRCSRRIAWKSRSAPAVMR